MLETSDSPRATVAIVLVNWNGWRHVLECVDSLLAQTHSSAHIFVVDNDSSDHSVEHIGAWCAAPRREPTWAGLEGVGRFAGASPVAPVPCRIVERSDTALPPPLAACRLTVIRAGSNRGFAAGCNIGIRAAGIDAYEFFWFLNTDAVAHRDALGALMRRARQDARVGIVGSTIRYYDRPATIQVLGGARMDGAGVTRHIGEGLSLAAVPVDGTDIERQMAYVVGASMLVSARFVREVGPMQEDYFLYGEEFDWALRGRDRFDFAYAPDSHVFHKSGASSSKVVHGFSTSLYYRNRIRLAARFFPERLPAVHRTLVMELLRHALRGRWTYVRIIAAALRDAPSITRQVRPTPS